MRKPPDELKGEAVKAWKTFAKLADEKVDDQALQILCETWATWREATEAVKRDGSVIVLPNGFPQVNPWQSVRVKSEAALVRLLREFGFTPASRAKLLDKKSEKIEPEELEF